MLHLQYAVVDASLLLSSEDAVADYRLTEKILADSQWTPLGSGEWSFGYEYRFYPITNFIYATMSLLTGIPLLIVVKYLFVVKAIVVTPIVERFFRSFFSHRVAYLAAALFLASPGAILFPHKESFAMIFFFLGIFVATRTKKTRQFLLIGLFSILTLIMTHHFTTYVFLIILTSLFLASHLYEHQKVVRVSSSLYMLSLVVFVAWVAFIAWAIVALHQRLLFGVFFKALLPGELTFSELLPLYSPYEKIVVWLGFGTAMFSAGLGFLAYIRKRKKLSSSFLMMTYFFIPIIVVASIFRFAPQRGAASVIISHRVFEFGYIAIGALSALFFIRVIQSLRKVAPRIVLTSAIMFMIIVGPMAGAVHPRTFAKVSDVISTKALSLNTWMSESGANNEYVIGDSILNLILVGYGDSLVIHSSEFFMSQDFDLSSDIYSRSSYVITYDYMTDFYGPDAARFYASPYFHNLYTNGLLNVFRIASNTSS